MKPEYYASTTPGHRFNFGPFSTPEEACEACYQDHLIDHAKLTPGFTHDPGRGIVYCGTLSIFVPEIFADDIVESLSVQASADCGDVAEVWPDSTKMERERLQSAINMVVRGWLHDIGQEPQFGSMQDVVRYSRSEDGKWTLLGKEAPEPYQWPGIEFAVDPSPIRFNELPPDGRADVAQTCIHGNLMDHSCNHCARA